jgi:hypothetical protein
MYMKLPPPFDPSQAFGGQRWNDHTGKWEAKHPTVAITPHFDGATYDAEKDHARLTSQLQRVSLIISDGRWHSLFQLSKLTGDPEGSVSARLRDLRKDKFGSQIIERKRKGNTFLYRLGVRIADKDGQVSLF